MSDNELAAIAARPDPENSSPGDGEAPAGDPETWAGSASAGAEPREHDPMIAVVLAELVDAIAGMVTSRFNVSVLRAEESAAIGVAGANVLAQYDVGELSPRAAAWLGLGIAVVGVSIPRVRQYRDTIEAEAEEVEPPDAGLRVVDDDNDNDDG